MFDIIVGFLSGNKKYLLPISILWILQPHLFPFIKGLATPKRIKVALYTICFWVVNMCLLFPLRVTKLDTGEFVLKDAGEFDLNLMLIGYGASLVMIVGLFIWSIIIGKKRKAANKDS